MQHSSAVLLWMTPSVERLIVCIAVVVVVAVTLLSLLRISCSMDLLCYVFLVVHYLLIIVSGLVLFSLLAVLATMVIQCYVKSMQLLRRYEYYYCCCGYYYFHSFCYNYPSLIELLFSFDCWELSVSRHCLRRNPLCRKNQ